MRKRLNPAWVVLVMGWALPLWAGMVETKTDGIKTELHFNDAGEDHRACIRKQQAEVSQALRGASSKPKGITIQPHSEWSIRWYPKDETLKVLAPLGQTLPSGGTKSCSPVPAAKITTRRFSRWRVARRRM